MIQIQRKSAKTSKPLFYAELLIVTDQNLCHSTDSLTRLLLEQLKEQHLQIAEMRANEARHRSGIEDIRRSYDKELLRLQTLLTKRQATRSNISLNDSSKEEKDLEAENNHPEDLKDTSKKAELQKEIAFQNHLIEGFQRENEVLMKENKELKQKLASTLIPSEDANAIAERLVHENARLQIDFQQVKNELIVLKSAQDLPSKKENSTSDIREELEQTIRRLEEESRLNGGLKDSLQKLEAELKQTKEEQLRLQNLLSASDSKWNKEVRDRQRRIATLNTELKKVQQDYTAAMQRVQERTRWQNYTKSVSSRHVSTIKKQKLEIMKLKTELEKNEKVISSREKVEDHDVVSSKDNRRYSAHVKELQAELRASQQRANRLETQLNTLSRVHMAVITGKPPDGALKWHFCVGKEKLNRENNLNNGHSMDMENESSASYWRLIAEKRTKDIALLSREVDKLTNLLEEISTRNLLTTQSRERTT
ncbi:hypothetical protein TcWFU_002595 [Taenia crassiceps]|uniref:Centrosomal protein of 162 kDa n=1 Tax=Taenia crassiceps TaxID=6207 RepID=A0ABR4QP70_9CEST